MIKKKDRDSQILLKMLKCQQDITDTMKEYACEEVEEAVENQRVVDLLHFYTLRLVALTKGLSKKTKDEFSDTFDTVADGTLSVAGQYAYPTISNTAIVEYAMTLSDPPTKQLVKDVYMDCIGKGN